MQNLYTVNTFFQILSQIGNTLDILTIDFHSPLAERGIFSAVLTEFQTTLFAPFIIHDTIRLYILKGNNTNSNL